MSGQLARRVAFNTYLLGRALVMPNGCLRPKCFVAAGAFYQLLPVDLIPNRIFLVGYADNVAAVLTGAALAWITIPGDYVALLRSPTLPPDHAEARRALDDAAGRLRNQMHTLGWKGRLQLITLFGMLLCRPVVRLALGRPARRSERLAFRKGLRQRHVVLPPLMRALAAVPDARPVLTQTMLTSWLLADQSYQGRLRRGLDSRDSDFTADRLRVWTGRPISFLHLEKTAGTSLLAVISSQFHPGQIDPDPCRGSPPHLVTPFTPNALERIRYYPLVWGHYDLPSLRRLDPGRFVFTMLRSPADRLLSLYYFWRSLDPALLGQPDENPQVRAAHRLGLLEFLRSDDPVIVNFIDSFYVRRLLGLYAQPGHDPLREQEAVLDQALAALASIDFVGITEHASRSFARLGMMLGVEALREAPRLNRGADTDRSPDFRPVLREPHTAEIAAELDRLTSLDRCIYRAALARFDVSEPGPEPA
ncbi:YkvA family protein [Lichenicola sp.]|uniref:YkvA family protein n=1 Tax=Lichenicola sp. TaxID=2804529 RepID=UPI003AFFA0A1